MTATPSAKPVAVTHMPTVHRVPAHAASPAAPIVNRAPATPLPVRSGAPITGGVVAHHPSPTAAPVARTRAPIPPIARTSAPLPPVARPAPLTVHQHQPVMPAGHRTGYPQSYPHNSHPYHSRPPHQPPMQSRGPNLGGAVLALMGLGLIAGVAGAFRRRTPSSGAAPYGQQGSIADSMTPSKFTSFMNAAIEGHENNRTAVRSGQILPTSPEERQYFKQLAYLMMTRDGKQVDPQGMFTPEVLNAIQSGRMDRDTLGSDISHFSSGFGSTVKNAQNQDVPNPLARDLYANYDYLRTQYASEYRQTQEQERGYRSEPRVASFSGAPYSSAPYSSPRSMIIPIFRI